MDVLSCFLSGRHRPHRPTGRVSLQGNEISRQALMASFGAGEPERVDDLLLMDAAMQCGTPQ